MAKNALLLGIIIVVLLMTYGTLTIVELVELLLVIKSEGRAEGKEAI